MPRRSVLFAATLAVATSFVGCEGRPGLGSASKEGESLTGPYLVELNLTRGASEGGASTLFGGVPGTSHADLVTAIRDIDTAEAKGVFVRLGTARFGLAGAGEVGRLLGDIRNKGVPVICHADELDNGSLLLAARGCSKLWLSPGGSVDSVGIAFQLIFGRSLFDKLGVTVDFLQVGKYKGAQEPYTRDEPSPEARETVEGTLADLRKAWISGIAEGRGAKVEGALEDGPHPAETAKALGLIDEIGFLDDARDQAKADTGATRTTAAFGGKGADGGGFDEVLRALSGSDPSSDPHVAVVRATGAISMGGGGGLLSGDGGISEQKLGKILKELEHDDAVKAVVLRIDSPGGSALASDLLWHRLVQLKKKKPLVISIGGMAASGGYYLSCAGSRIFAEPTSIVGSIGVVAGKLSFDEPLSKLGVNVVTIPAAPDPKKAARATMLSSFDKWDDATRAKMLASMESIYALFLKRVGEGRGIDAAALESAAQGRIFGGERAKSLKLVDDIGGLADAIDFALAESGLGAEGKVRLRGQPGGLAELLAGGDEAARAAVLQAAHEMDPLSRLLAGFPGEVEDWVRAMAPLGAGEKMVTATPFVLMGVGPR
ncbi:MAG: signal peptide peptidase SppA [Myxococcales bacterium]|nr:signal peptide peptidase SppA [Myxococcales bacterium]